MGRRSPGCQCTPASTPKEADAGGSTKAHTSRTEDLQLERTPQEMSFLSLCGELRNQIYEYCIPYGFFDIAQPRTPGAFNGLLAVHPKVSREFTDIYLSASIFLLDARQGFKCHNYNIIENVWKPWLNRLDERRAGLIQNLRITTPVFRAAIHIPSENERSSPIVVDFRNVEHIPKDVETAVLDFFRAKLQRFNRRVAGEKLRRRDLDYLIKAVLMVVPYCCIDPVGARDVRLCSCEIGLKEWKSFDRIPATCSCFQQFEQISQRYS